MARIQGQPVSPVNCPGFWPARAGVSASLWPPSLRRGEFAARLHLSPSRLCVVSGRIVILPSRDALCLSGFAQPAWILPGLCLHNPVLPLKPSFDLPVPLAKWPIADRGAGDNDVVSVPADLTCFAAAGSPYLPKGHIGRAAAFDGDPYLVDSILYVRLFGLFRGTSTTSAICPCSAPVHEVAWPVASVPLGT